MEKHILKENVIKFVHDDEKVQNIKFDITVKGIVKNISIMIIVGLITRIMVTLNDQYLYAVHGIILGLVSG
jgi:hypothetical protein